MSSQQVCQIAVCLTVSLHDKISEKSALTNVLVRINDTAVLIEGLFPVLHQGSKQETPFLLGRVIKIRCRWNSCAPRLF